MSTSYPLNPSSYHLLHEIGSSACTIVYKAECLPLNSSLVAIKCIDLDRTDAKLEAGDMAILSHPNILTAHCFFTVDRHLWVVMPFMDAGSLQSIISSSYPSGLPEESIVVILKEILRALDYLHRQAHLHGGIKAGNILLDSSGVVKLSDLGVSASTLDSLSSVSALNEEVTETPYWMAPEVMHSHVLYGLAADIWSFGITALEVAHGRPPLSHLPASKWLVKKMKDRLGVNYDIDLGDVKCTKKVSKAFEDLIACCLDHDPSERPSAERLLMHPLFKNCKSTDFLVESILQGLPPIEERFKKTRATSISDEDKGELVTVESRRITGWSFNEHEFELEPIFPDEQRSGKRVQFEREVVDIKEEEDEKSSEDAIYSWLFSLEGGDDQAKEEKVVTEDDYQETVEQADGVDNDPEEEEQADGEDHDQVEEEQKDGEDGQREDNRMQQAKVGIIPNLVTLAESLTMQTSTVMDLLKQCGVSQGNNNNNPEEGGQFQNRGMEERLVKLANDLQRHVDNLTFQLDQEKKKNAILVEEIDALERKMMEQNHLALSDDKNEES